MSRAELRWAEKIAKEVIARERDDNELTEDDAFLEYADARADEIEPPHHTHVFETVRRCRVCGAKPHLFYREVEGVQVTGETL